MKKSSKRRASAFLGRLDAHPLVCDGAMGTMLYAKGAPLEACFDVLNLNEPDLVQEVHRDYILAGADIIETNTFGGNRFKLAVHGLEGKVRDINLRAVKLARDVRESTGRDVLVGGSIGPLGKYLQPVGTIDPEEARAAFREQGEALLEGGVDLIILETFSDLREITEAVLAVRATCDLPILAQMTFNEELVTFAGHTPEEVVEGLAGLGVDAIGANCSVGPSVLYDVLQAMVRCNPALPMAIQPNAGLPTRVGERLMYLSSPVYMAEYAEKMLQAGARIVGGCCGTTPGHIEAMREVVDAYDPTRVEERVHVEMRTPEPTAPETASTAEPTPLARALGRRFWVTVEFDPPRGHNVEKVIAGAKMLKARGTDSADINDGSLGRIRMGALPTALLVRNATDLDVILHFTCRDRNLMGIQADLLGAHALGIRNILSMTGDPPRQGDYINMTAVFDIDAVGLVKLVSDFNRGVDVTGKSIGEPTNFTMGIALTPEAENLDREVERFHKKVEAGAQWAQTQPIYDLAALDRFFEKAGPSPIPVIAGILPLQSHRHTEFLHNEVPGIEVPDEVRARMKDAGDRGRNVGTEMAQEILIEVRKRCAGAYLMPSFGRYEVIAEVLSVLEGDDRRLAPPAPKAAS